MAYEAKIQGVGFVLAILARGEPEVRKRLTAVLRDTGREFTRAYQREHLRGGPTATSVGRRTGNLAKSFDFRIHGTSLSDLGLVLGFGPPAVTAWPVGAEQYVKTHLEGREIRPKRGKFLAVPVGKGLTATGVARFASLRDLSDIEFVPHLFRSGMGYLAIQRPAGAKRGDLVALLLRKVTVPKRLDLEAAWLARGAPVLLKRMNTAMDGAVKGLQQGGARG